MRVLVLPSRETAAIAVAGFLARTLRRTPNVVLGLPTGRTMVPVYRALVALHHNGLADFSRATTFNLDEFSGLSSRHDGSFRAYMRRHLFDHVNLDPRASHFPCGGAADGRRYERAIEAAGGLDLCLCGIGRNGHIGFNEPARTLVADTHRVSLHPATRRANAYLFGGSSRRVPKFAMSMGVGTILRARALILLALGESKAAIVDAAIRGPVTTRVPASLLQTHPNVVIVLDRDAAARVSRRQSRRAGAAASDR